MLGASPRERLGEQLRRYRRKAGLSQEELAARIGTSQPTVSKIESGKARNIEHDVVRDWLRAVESGSDQELLMELLALASSGTSVTDWAVLHATGWAEHQRRYDELESSASRIRLFQNALVPGLMQTSAYTSYLLTTVVGLSPEAVGHAVAGRLTRQEIFWRPATRIRAILTEAVLRHRLGGPVVLVEQLGRLADLSRLPTVELGIIPVDTDMPTRYGASFDLYEGLDGGEDSAVLVELEDGEVRETDPDRIARYAHRHDEYWCACLTGGDAEALLDGISHETRRRIFG